MFLVSAVIRPHLLELVTDALKAMGVAGITVHEAHGFGHDRAGDGRYRGAGYEIDHTPRIRLDVVADAWAADSLAKVIAVAARSAAGGDGRVWVTRLAGVTRVRTGEVGPDAI